MLLHTAVLLSEARTTKEAVKLWKDLEHLSLPNARLEAFSPPPPLRPTGLDPPCFVYKVTSNEVWNNASKINEVVNWGYSFFSPTSAGINT